MIRLVLTQFLLQDKGNYFKITLQPTATKNLNKLEEANAQAKLMVFNDDNQHWKEGFI